MKFPASSSLGRRWSTVRSRAARVSQTSTEPQPPSTRSRLRLVQDGSTVLAHCMIDAPDAATAVWAECGGTWFSLGAVSTGRQKGSSVEYVAKLDLEEVAAQVAQIPREMSVPDDQAGARVVFYLEVTAPGGEMRRQGRPMELTEADETRSGDPASPVDWAGDAPLRYRDALGGYDRTTIPTFFEVETPHGTVSPYLNRQGLLAAMVGAPLPPAGKVTNDGLRVHGGVVTLKGTIEARHVPVAEASLVVQGRTTGFRGIAPARFELDRDASERAYGLRIYHFSARYDLTPDLVSGRLSDDVADLFLELRAEGSQELYKRRVGRSRYVVRLRTSGDSVTRGDRTLAIEPYYTFKAKYPSLHLELFDAGTYRHLQQRLSRVRPLSGRRPAGARPVWVIGELPYKAQDNGLHFFRHMRDHHPELDAYYVIKPDSPERRNLHGYEDHVLDYRSPEHIDAVLAAERIVGSHDPDFLYPTRARRFRRRVGASPVFLQHGVTAAKWMVPKYGKQASGFDTSLVCVCSEREKEFFVKDFGYAPHEVAITGFARFDALFHPDVVVDRRQLLIMPTWRPWLQDLERFTESDYYHHWSELLSAPEMRRLQEDVGAEVVLCLHPNMQQYSHHFTSPHVRVVYQGDVDVQHLIKESALMVTDYSSVAFDFAFLRKPVIYYQFDSERFDPPHADPRTEFPGPVVESRDGMLRALGRAFDQDLVMEQQYWERAQRFCANIDEQNCERIFAAVRDADRSRSLRARVRTSTLPGLVTRKIRKNKHYLPTMRKLYAAFKRLPMDTDLIVFESGQGRQFADSPRYIYEELLLRGDTRKKVWIYTGKLPVADEHTLVVPRHSVGFYWYLARAKFWVNNHTFPDYITRRPHGEYIQTWHGTPLKRMFLDQRAWFGRDAGYKARMTRAVRQWSVLVSPSPYATACMRSAYDWTGPVLEVGYPRNDVLVAPGADERAARVRENLGIPPGKRVVLYAPTFRDNRPTRRGRFSAEVPLDLAEWSRRFGDDHVLLIRTHVLISNRVAIPDEARAHVVDVSRYPDMQELLLASDVLVTDYSSSFFDYALLGRPIIFYAYDLEEYAEQLRGFYLPYDDSLPGEIVRDEAALLDAMEAAAHRAVPDDRVVRFAATYAPRDDGQASSRVIDELL
ncbi:MAG: CDP-glycerol glycerophosphotransferase family protein [Ornithinibacter sp.]